MQKKAGHYFYKEDPNGVYRLGWITDVFDSGAFNVKFAGAMYLIQFTHEHGKHLWGPKGGQKAMEKTWKASINKTIKKKTAVKKVPAAGKKATAEGEEKATAEGGEEKATKEGGEVKAKKATAEEGGEAKANAEEEEVDAEEKEVDDDFLVEGKGEEG